MSVSKSVPSVIYFFTDFSLRIGIYMYKFQFFVGILRSLTAKSDKFREIKETSISGFFGFFLFKFCFSELTSLTWSFQNVSYSRPISRNLMEGHCLLIKRSPGQYMYIIYLTFFFNKRRITITNNFYI